MARSLPDDWEVDITFAVNGEDAMDKLRKGLGSVLFLDLNMPILDGYGVLEAIKKENLPVLTITCIR